MIGSRIPRIALLVGAMTAMAGCGDAASSTETSGLTPAPGETCSGGTMPTAEASCAPVGPTACAEGFEAHPTGFGCVAIVPEEACPLPLRAKLGSRECVPVDDCEAAFPPPKATLVTEGESLDAAIAKAPEGGVIAIDEGTYDITDAVVTKDLTVIGRCASKVKLRAKKKDVFLVGKGATLDVRSVWMTSKENAVYAIERGHAKLSNVIITDAPLPLTSSRESTLEVTSSLIVGDETYPSIEQAAAGAIRGASLSIVDSDVHGFRVAGTVFNDGTRIAIRRSVVTYDGPDDRKTTLALAYEGGELEIEESLLRSRRTGVLATNDSLERVGDNPGGSAARIVVRSSVLSQHDAPISSSGVLLVSSAGRATLEETTVEHAGDTALRVFEAGSQITVKNSAVHVVADVGGMEHSALNVIEGGAADVAGTAILGPVLDGIVVMGRGSKLSFARSLIADTHFRTSTDDGARGGALALSFLEGARGTLVGSAVTGSEQYGIYAAVGSLVTADAVLVEGTRGAAAGVDGVAVMTEEAGAFSASRSVFRHNDAAFAFRCGGSVVGESSIVGNGIVIRIDGASLVEASEAPAYPSEDDVIFWRNELAENGAYTSHELPPPVVPPPFVLEK